MYTRIPLFLLLSAFLCADLSAQVARQIIVEHFTNTRCGICSSRNPGFYTNLASQDNVLHVAFHPSAPYSSCLLNQHNVIENDDRTKFYSIYGSTPRLVIQGNALSTITNYGSSTIFDDYENVTTPIGLSFSEASIDEDSIRIELVATTTEVHNILDASLFVALVEDTIFYNAPNGEDEHYDVFRRAFTPAEGMTFSLASEVDGTTTFQGALAIDPEWDTDRIYPIAILQETSDRSVIQSAAGPVVSDVISSVHNQASFSWKLYPNPAQDYIFLENVDEPVRLYNILGTELARFFPSQDLRIDLSNYPKGTYLIKVGEQKQQQVRMFVKQ